MRALVFRGRRGSVEAPVRGLRDVTDGDTPRLVESLERVRKFHPVKDLCESMPNSEDRQREVAAHRQDKLSSSAHPFSVGRSDGLSTK